MSQGALKSVELQRLHILRRSNPGAISPPDVALKQSGLFQDCLSKSTLRNKDEHPSAQSISAISPSSGHVYSHSCPYWSLRSFMCLMSSAESFLVPESRRPPTCAGWLQMLLCVIGPAGLLAHALRLIAVTLVAAAPRTKARHLPVFLKTG